MVTNRVKTFIEHQYFQREGEAFVPVAPGGMLPLSQGAIDAQVAAWIEATGNTVVFAGPLSVNTTWYGSKEDPFQVRCVTLGLVLLYQRGSHDRERTSSDDIAAVPFDEPGDTSADAAAAGGSNSSAIDRPGTDQA